MTNPDSPQEMIVTIANASVQVPVCHDAATTRDIAHKVGDRIEEISRGYPRLDTHAFALRAAFEFAAALHAANQEQSDENHELALVLEPLVTKLRKMIAEFDAV